MSVTNKLKNMKVFKTTVNGVPLFVEYQYDKIHEDMIIEGVFTEDSDIDIYYLLDEKIVERILEETFINFENEY